MLNVKGNIELVPHELYNNNPLYRTFLPAKSKNYTTDKINHPKASNNTTAGDILPLIKSKTESLVEFIDNLTEGQETNLYKTSSFVNLKFSLKQEYETSTLTLIELCQFSGNPIDWPEFIKNFCSRVHLKNF